MALVTKTDTATADAGSIVLELALYNLYNRQGVMYEKGKGYKFSVDAAMELLTEMDAGRPVWKRYSPPKQNTKAAPVVVDYSKQSVAPVPTETPHGTPSPSKRIDIGDESELADLNLTDGTVTV